MDPFGRAKIFGKDIDGVWTLISEIKKGRMTAVDSKCSTLASCDSFKKTLTLMDLDTNQETFTLQTALYPDKSVKQLYLSKSGRHLLAVQDDRLTLIDVDAEKVVQTVKYNYRRPEFTVTGGGHYLASSNENVVIEIATGKTTKAGFGTSYLNVTPDQRWIVFIDDTSLHFHPLADDSLDSHVVKLPCEHPHWHSIAFAQSSGRIVLSEVFSDNAYVVEYPFKKD